MANRHKAKVEQDVTRVVHRLMEQSAEFEQQGIDETSLASVVGLTEGEVQEAVDYLENHEDVVRWPQPGRRFVLKPGRGWADLVKKQVGAGQST